MVGCVRVFCETTGPRYLLFPLYGGARPRGKGSITHTHTPAGAGARGRKTKLSQSHPTALDKRRENESSKSPLDPTFHTPHTYIGPASPTPARPHHSSYRTDRALNSHTHTRIRNHTLTSGAVCTLQAAGRGSWRPDARLARRCPVALPMWAASPPCPPLPRPLTGPPPSRLDTPGTDSRPDPSTPCRAAAIESPRHHPIDHPPSAHPHPPATPTPSPSTHTRAPAPLYAAINHRRRPCG